MMKKNDLIKIYDGISRSISLNKEGIEEIRKTLEFVKDGDISNMTLNNLSFHFIINGLKTHAFITEQLAKNTNNFDEKTIQTFISLAKKYNDIDYEFETCDTSKKKM